MDKGAWRKCSWHQTGWRIDTFHTDTGTQNPRQRNVQGKSPKPVRILLRQKTVSPGDGRDIYCEGITGTRDETRKPPVVRNKKPSTSWRRWSFSHGRREPVSLPVR
jgi:hypothetical protein